MSSNAEPMDIVLIIFQSTTDVDNNIQDDLEAIDNCYIFIDDIDACITKIESTKEKIFLIISGNKAYALLPRIIHQSQLDLIFIYPAIPKDYERLYEDFPKVLGIFDDSIELIEAIKENIKKVSRQMEVISFYDKNQRSTRDLEEQSTEFLWFRLFRDVIEQLPHDEKAKIEMLTTCRQYYQGNPRMNRDIDEFEQFYHSGDCIAWYTRETFIYKLINKALRTEDIEQLYIFRYFISDLSRQLADRYQLMKSLPEKILRLYRGVPTLKQEFEKLKKNIGKTFAANSYWSTSRDRSYALTFAKSSVDRENIAAVLYEIECNLENENDSTIFTDISDISRFPGEREVLFDAGSVFQIENIEEEMNDNGDITICTINVKTIEEDQQLENEYREYNRKQMNEEGPRIMFSILLKRMGKFKKSLQFLYNLLANPDGENVAYIHNRIGIALKDNAKYYDALMHFDKAFKMTYYSDPPDRKYSAYVLHNKGLVYAKQKNYENALQYYRRAISVLNSQGDNDNFDIGVAQFYNSIGRLLLHQKRFDEALAYQLQALKIRESFTPNHVMNAFVYADIGNIYCAQRNYEKALEYHVQALELRKKFLPKDNHCIAWSIHQVGKIYYNINDLPTARDLYQQSLEIYRTYLHTDLNWKIPDILEDIASTYQDNYQTVLDYRLKALDIREKHLTHNRVSLAKLLDDIAYTYKSMSRKQDALNYYHKALKVREQFIPPYDYDYDYKLSDNFRHLARLYEEIGDMNNAFIFYNELLNIYEYHHSPNYYLCQQVRRDLNRIRHHNPSVKTTEHNLEKLSLK